MSPESLWCHLKGARGVRGVSGRFGARDRVLQQSEVIRVIWLEDSPCCRLHTHMHRCLACTRSKDSGSGRGTPMLVCVCDGAA